MSRSPRGHDSYTHCSTLVIDASCQVSLKSVHLKRVFTIYEHGGHLGHMTWIIYSTVRQFPVIDSKSKFRVTKSKFRVIKSKFRDNK